MACTVNRTPLLKAIASRGFATQANPKVVSVGRAELQVTTLPNKLVVASVDGYFPTSRVSIALRAGSRNETYENAGLTHVLRATAGFTNKKSTVFAVKRNVQTVGGDLNVSSDREVISYNLDVTKDHLDTAVQFLQHCALEQEFKPWEVNEAPRTIRIDLSRVTQEQRAVELLHKAAFNRELGNSVYCPEHQVGNISSEALKQFVANNFTANRAALVGVGVSHQLLVGLAKHFRIDAGSDNVTASKYVGGVGLTQDTKSSTASVAIGTQGVNVSNPKDALAFAVLQQVAGTGVQVQGGNSNGALGKVVSGVLSKPFTFSALNASYTDNGLFGFVLTADAGEVGKAVDAALKALKSGSVAQNDVNRGKEQLKTLLLTKTGTSAGLGSDLVQQALLTGQAQSNEQILAAIDAVSVSDVTAAAKKVASGKLSLGAVGNLANVPHVSQL